MESRTSLAQLAERIEAIEGGRFVRERGEEGLSTGWPHPQAAHLAAGSLHEWFAGHSRVAEARGWARGSANHSRWTPPLFILAHLARRAVERDDAKSILWIGRRVHPYAAALGQTHPPWLSVALRGQSPSPSADAACSLLDRSLFIDAGDLDARIWAIDLALRSPAVSMVVADGSGMTMAPSRRLQLAAQSQGAIALLARPPWEMKEHSCAATRWTVARARSSGQQPQWFVTCVRCKGVQRVSAMEAALSSLLLERCRATGRIRVAADVVDRPDQAVW